MATDLYELIEKERASLQAQLDAATEAREKLNEQIKDIRALMDDLPVKKTRRPKKAKATEPEDDRSVFDVARGIKKRLDDVSAKQATIEEIVGAEEGL